MSKARIPELMEKIQWLQDKLERKEEELQKALNRLDLVCKLLKPVVEELNGK